MIALKALVLCCLASSVLAIVHVEWPGPAPDREGTVPAYRSIILQTYVTPPDPLRRTAPAHVTKWGAPMTFNPEVPVGPWTQGNVTAPYQCSFDASLACGQVQKYWITCAAPQNYIPDPSQLAGFMGIPPEYLYDPTIDFPPMPMYHGQCDTSPFPRRTMTVGLGYPEGGLAYLHHCQAATADPNLQVVCIIPEVGILDWTLKYYDAYIFYDRSLTRRLGRRYVMDHQHIFGVPRNSNTYNMGHSDDGASVVGDVIGQVNANLPPTDDQVTLLFPLDGAWWYINGQKNLGGEFPLNVPMVNFASAMEIGGQGTLGGHCFNSAYRKNIWLLNQNGDHAMFAPFQYRLARTMLKLNATIWNGNVTYPPAGGFPPPSVWWDNATMLYGQTLRNVERLVTGAIGSWDYNNRNYDYRVNHDDMLNDQRYADGSYRYQFVDIPGGCDYLTTDNVLKLVGKIDQNWEYSSYAPSVEQKFVRSYQSEYFTDTAPQCLVFLNGLNTDGILQPTAEQYRKASFGHPKYVGPCVG